MAKNDPLPLIRDKILASRRIAVTSHLRPDGDSICTSLALAGMIERLAKKASIINCDPLPLPFSRMPQARRIRQGQIPPGRFDLVILLECANVSRSGQKSIDPYFKINIDHHYSNDSYAEINWIDPQASAVGEMAFRLGVKMGIPFTPKIAENLYCAIVSDTGCFQFSNTTAKALEISSRLLKSGANPIKISDFLFHTNPPEKIKLLGQVLSTLKMNQGGNIATITMFKSDLEALRLREMDTEDITTLARSIRGVEMVLFFKEMGPNTFRVSLRSKGRSNAAGVAEYFGGGGHVHAAGFTAVGPYDRLIREIPRRVERLLNRKGPPSRRAGCPPGSGE